MKNIFSTKNRKSIIIGIVSTIICVYFVDPILSFLGNVGLYIIRSASDTLYNRLFEEIALGRPEYAFTLIVLLFAIVTIPLVFILFGIPFAQDERDELNTYSPTEMEQALTLSGTPDEGRSKGRNLLWKITTIILFLLGLAQLTFSDIKIKTIQVFEQRIKILTPYMLKGEKEKIISEFSQMKTFKDFEKIDIRLMQLADSANLKLPDTRNHIF